MLKMAGDVIVTFKCLWCNYGHFVWCYRTWKFLVFNHPNFPEIEYESPVYSNSSLQQHICSNLDFSLYFIKKHMSEPCEPLEQFFKKMKILQNRTVLWLPYFPANKPRPVFSSENESFSILPPNKPNQKVTLPNYRYLFFFLQQSLSGMRYIHYAPTHVLYNHCKIDPTCAFNCCSDFHRRFRCSDFDSTDEDDEFHGF